MSGDQEIVWPEHVYDDDRLSHNNDAASQTSKGSDGISRPSNKARRSQLAHGLSSYPAETSASREYWDHDSRNYTAYRPPAALEDDSKWEHDKFDLLKIGPPPGLGASQRSRHSGAATSGQLQPGGFGYQGRQSPSVIPAARFQQGQKFVQVPKLTPTEQQSLRQVNQRTNEMAAIMAQIGGQHEGSAGRHAQPTRPSQPHGSMARPSMNHMFSASKQVHSGIQSSPASTKSASSQQAKAAVPKARKVLPITEPSPTTSKAQKVLPITESRKAQAATSTQTGIQSQSRLSRNVAGHQNGEKPRKHALLIVDPDSKAQVLPPAPKPSMAEPRVAAISMTQNAPRSSKHLLSIVDPTNKQSVQLVHSSPATDKPAAPNARAVSRPAIKRALQIIDPQNKEAVTVPAQLDQLSGSQLSRTVSSTSAASSDHGRTGKRPVAITDPHHKQPVQLPVRADSLGRNHLLRTVSSTSAASTDSNRPGKRALAIVDPYNKEHVRLPAPSFKSAIPSSSAQRKALTIVDPHNKQPVLLPGSTGSELGGVQTESRSELELHSLS